MSKLNSEIEKMYHKLLQYQLDKDWKEADKLQRLIEKVEEKEEQAA